MNPLALDAEFLKVNGRLGVVPDEAIGAAQKKQMEDMFSGRPPRPLVDILREQGALPAEAEATLREFIEGKKPLPPPSAAAAEADSDLWMKTPHSLLEMSRPADASGADVTAALESLEDSLGAADLQDLPKLSERQELELGQRAVRHGMIRLEQLRECLGKQLDEITRVRRKDAPPKTPEPKPKRSLVAILVERKYLTIAQVDALLNEPTRHPQPPLR